MQQFIYKRVFPPPSFSTSTFLFGLFNHTQKEVKEMPSGPTIPLKGGFTLLSINMSVCLSHLAVLSATFSFFLLLCPVLVLLSMTHNPFISLCLSLPLCVAGYSCPVLLTVLCPAVTFRGKGLSACPGE